MRFIKPEIKEIEFKPIALMQTGGPITQFTLSDGGCPSVTYENGFQDGTYDFQATLELNDDTGECGTVELSGTATVEGHTLTADCEKLQVNCINVTCNYSDAQETSYEVCLEEATVDGEPQEGLPICDAVNTADLENAFGSLCQ